MATGLTELSARLKKYTAAEIVLASDNFSWQLRSESVGIWGSAYKGYIQNDTVSIKFLNSSEERQFESRVKSLSLIRHPHLLAMMGFCSELKCFVYEYIEDSCSLLKVVKQNLLWPIRIRIARDICSALCYIKTAREGPIAPDYLNASNILIDSNRNAKVNVVMKRCHKVYYNPDFGWDVKTFGYVILSLLTGIPGNCVSYFYVRWCVGLPHTLDKTAGQWPMDLAEKLMNLCRRCVDCNPRDDFRKKYIMVVIVKEMNEITEMANGIVGGHDSIVAGGRAVRRDQDSDIPRQFYCPIYKEVMSNPYVAADGFSYELQGIEKWLQSHDTSPMTNLKLKDKVLTPNGTLKLLIRDWCRERSIPYPGL
ncbi:hypothetical protein M0R45_004905 [Rubus argutus]|uniref:RING-type E3 ubiquitin transferase n=1 Tax=Rubus argutus TaxID=59490 RepID=A0AAW1YL80_RUBAR